MDPYSSFRFDLASDAGKLPGVSPGQQVAIRLSERLRDNFANTVGMLLILGEPGCGKSTALILHALQILGEGGPESVKRLPFVLNLASWAPGRPPIKEWIISEIVTQYDVPKKIGQRWVSSGACIPLMDGLDELSVSDREAVILSINELFKSDVIQIAVACRSEYYLSLDVQIDATDVVELHPLSWEDIRTYLSNAGVTREAVGLYLASDPILWNMLRSPLVLRIAADAYSEQDSVKLLDGPVDSARQRLAHLFDSYISVMVARAKPSLARMLNRWLRPTAILMRTNNIGVLHLDRLQRNALGTVAQRRVVSAGTTIAFALAVGLVDALIYSLLRGPEKGIVNGVMWGLFCGLFIGLRVPSSSGLVRNSLWRVIVAALGAIIVGAAFWQLSSWPDAKAGSRAFFLVFIFFAGLRSTEPVENIRRSRRKTVVGSLFGFTSGLGLGVVYGQSYRIFENTVDSLFFALACAVIFSIAGGIVYGTEPAVSSQRVAPNQRIRRSAARALSRGIVIGATSGIVLSFVFTQTSLISDAVGQGLRDGYLIGAVVAILCGGLACLQYLSARALLVFAKVTPVRYARFLESALDAQLLRRIEGGYAFIHPLMLKHVSQKVP